MGRIKNMGHTVKTDYSNGSDYILEITHIVNDEDQHTYYFRATDEDSISKFIAEHVGDWINNKK